MTDYAYPKSYRFYRDRLIDELCTGFQIAKIIFLSFFCKSITFEYNCACRAWQDSAWPICSILMHS